METIVQNVIEADRIAREKVLAKVQERKNIKQSFADHKKEILNKYEKEMNACIENEKKRIQENVSCLEKSQVTTCQERLAQLQKQFDEHKEEWVNKIFDQCLQDD